MITFNLRLGDTYWSKGFFNVPIDFERYLTKTDGPIEIFLGYAVKPLVGRVSRAANMNATPRIYGNKPLAKATASEAALSRSKSFRQRLFVSGVWRRASGRSPSQPAWNPLLSLAAQQMWYRPTSLRHGAVRSSQS